MAKVRSVDRRCSSERGSGCSPSATARGLRPQDPHLHTWLPDPDMASTYNTWAAQLAGVDADLSTEVEWVREVSETTENTYVMALAANVLARAGDERRAHARQAGRQAGRKTARCGADDERRRHRRKRWRSRPRPWP